ncbi:MAG TPA: GON domain-containing protein [Kofleriaceae bacterium]|nr:GON domain-containing protein [Kofleriaceae bacterium]
MTKRLMKMFGLMLIAGGSMNCMSGGESGPATCKDAKAAYGVSSDGPQTLYVGGDKTMPWSAFCVGMTGDDPKEYIELPQFSASGKPANFSEFIESPPIKASLTASDDTTTFKVSTQYTKVRIDPVDLTIDITNNKFSPQATITPAGFDPISIALGGNLSVGSVPYGVAMECGDDVVHTDPNDPSKLARVTANANIDLTGLPFELADTDLCPGVGGSSAVADSMAPTKIVNFHAQGSSTTDGTMTCGRASVRCLPDPAVNGQVGGQRALQLRYVGASTGFGF